MGACTEKLAAAVVDLVGATAEDGDGSAKKKAKSKGGRGSSWDDSEGDEFTLWAQVRS